MKARDLLAPLSAALFSVLLFMVGAIAPAGAGLAMLLSPFPILHAAVGARRSAWRSLAMSVIAAGLIGAAGGVAAAATYIITVGLAATMMCYLLEDRQPLERIVGITALLMVGVGAVSAIWLAGSVQALTQLLRTNLTTTLQQAAKASASLGLSTALTMEYRAGIIEWTLQLMPALALLSAAFLVLANLALFWRFSGRESRLGYPLFGELARWSAPEWLIWVFLVAGFGIFAPLPEVRIAALNGFVCLAAIYLCQGLAIMSFYFRVLAMPRFARILIYLITAVQPVLAALVSVAGIFDLWVDFRRLRPSNPDPQKLSNLW